MKKITLIKFFLFFLICFSISSKVFAAETIMFTLAENASGVTKTSATIKTLTLIVDSADTTTKPVVDISVTDSHGVKTTKTSVSTVMQSGPTGGGAFDSTATFTNLLPNTTYTITAKATRGTWKDETIEVPSGTSQNFTTQQAVVEEWFYFTSANVLSSAFPDESTCATSRNASGVTNPCVKKGTAAYTAELTRVVNIAPAANKVFKDEYRLLAPIGSFTVLNKDTNIGDYVNLMFKIFLGLCGALAVIMIVIYGIQWMGTDSVFGKTEAKQNIAGSIGGLVLALGAWMLLNTINPDLLGGSLNILNAKIEIEGDVDAPVTENAATSTALGLTCPKVGGKNKILEAASSFNGKMTYSQDIPKGQMSNGKIKLDCSGYVNYVLQCVGVETGKLRINSGTSVIFNPVAAPIPTPTTPATTLIATSANQITDTTINGIPLEKGDLVGWKKGDNTDKYKGAGHVMIYVGDGYVTDSHSATNAFGKFKVTKYKNQIKFLRQMHLGN